MFTSQYEVLNLVLISMYAALNAVYSFTVCGFETIKSKLVKMAILTMHCHLRPPDVMPLPSKNLFGASNRSCGQTQCRFI